MNASRNTASLWVYKTHKHLSQSQCAWTPIRACADCLHCLVSITAQRQGRKASLFGTTASSLADGVKSKYQYFSFQITSVDCLFSFNHNCMKIFLVFLVISSYLPHRNVENPPILSCILTYRHYFYPDILSRLDGRDRKSVV